MVEERNLGDIQSPLLEASSSSSNAPETEASFKRTGSRWTAVAHIITGVIGAGVLSVAWSVAQLGWIGGPICMILFAAVTLLSTFLICDLYRYPDPEHGPLRIKSFMDAVKLYLGEKQQQICGVFAQANFYGCGIAYTITSGNSIKYVP